jgi:hypothetical protein
MAMKKRPEQDLAKKAKLFPGYCVFYCGFFRDYIRCQDELAQTETHYSDERRRGEKSGEPTK